jgi:hypothetical protein
MTRKTQASVGHRQAPVRKCKAAQRDREASLDRCAVRMRAGDESEEAKQGRQRLKATSGASLPLSSRNSFSATPRQGRSSTSRESRRFPGSVPDQTRLQSEVDATLIRIRRSFHPAWAIPITRPFPAFLPNRCSARSVVMVTEPRQCSNTTLVCDLVAGNREFITIGRRHRAGRGKQRSNWVSARARSNDH